MADSSINEKANLQGDTPWEPPKYDHKDSLFEDSKDDNDDIHRRNFLNQKHIILTTIILSAFIYGFELGTSPYILHSLSTQSEDCMGQKFFIKGWHIGGILACFFGGVTDTVNNRKLSILSVMILSGHKMFYAIYGPHFPYYTFERISSGFCATNLIISQSMLIWKSSAMADRITFSIIQQTGIHSGSLVALLVTQYFNQLEIDLSLWQFCAGITMLLSVVIAILLRTPILEVVHIDDKGFDKMRDPREMKMGELSFETPSFTVIRPYIVVFLIIGLQKLSGEYLVSYYSLRAYAKTGDCFNDTNFKAAFITALIRISACFLIPHFLKKISFKQIILQSLLMMTVAMTALAIFVSHDESQSGHILPVGSWQCDIVPVHSQIGALYAPIKVPSDSETNVWDITLLYPTLPTPLSYTAEKTCPAGIADNSNFSLELREIGIFLTGLFESGQKLGFGTFRWYFCHKIFAHQSWGNGLGLYMAMEYLTDLVFQNRFLQVFHLSEYMISSSIICALGLALLSLMLPGGKEKRQCSCVKHTSGKCTPLCIRYFGLGGTKLKGREGDKQRGRSALLTLQASLLHSELGIPTWSPVYM